MADDHKSGTPAHDESRRQFVKKAAYVAPVITSLAAAPAYVKAGSVKPDAGADWDAYRDKSDKDDNSKDKDKNKDKKKD